MAFIPVTHGAMVEFKYQAVGGLYWQNNYWFERVGFDNSEMLDLATALIAAWGATALVGNISTDVELVNITVTDMRQQNGGQVSLPTSVPGTNGTDMAAQAASLVITHRTALRGRSYRGRTYMAGITEGSIVDGFYLQSVADNLESWIVQMKAAATVEGWEFVIVSREQLGVPLAVAITTPVTISEVRSLRPGSQRRRNRRP